MSYRDERKFKEEEQDAPDGGFPAAGDQGAQQPGAMSHAEIAHNNRELWAPEFAGHRGVEESLPTPPPAPRPPSSREYVAPPSNLPAGVNLAELKEQASRKEDGGAPVPNTLPPPGF